METTAKTPKQKRSKVLVDSILEASTRILNQDIQASFTTNKVAEVAGVSIGSLYQYFKNKESIIHGILTKTMMKNFEELYKVLEHDNPNFEFKDFVEFIVKNQFKVWIDRPKVTKALFKYAPKLVDENFFKNNDKAVVGFMKQKIKERNITEITAKNLDLALLLCNQHVRMAIFNYFSYADEYDYEVWAEETAKMVYSYLTTD